jgi:hypothetical protein
MIREANHPFEWRAYPERLTKGKESNRACFSYVLLNLVILSEGGQFSCKWSAESKLKALGNTTIMSCLGLILNGIQLSCFWPNNRI